MLTAVVAVPWAGTVFSSDDGKAYSRSKRASERQSCSPICGVSVITRTPLDQGQDLRFRRSRVLVGGPAKTEIIE